MDMFPILPTGRLHNVYESIPLEIISMHEEQAIKNHGQTIKRLKERGGLNWKELYCILNNKSFEFIQNDKSMEIYRNLVLIIIGKHYCNIT